MMFVHPLENHIQQSLWQLAFYNMILYSDARSCTPVTHMNMRRIVVIDEHQDDNTIKPTYLWHINCYLFI